MLKRVLPLLAVSGLCGCVLAAPPPPQPAADNIVIIPVPAPVVTPSSEPMVAATASPLLAAAKLPLCALTILMAAPAAAASEVTPPTPNKIELRANLEYAMEANCGPPYVATP